ncbi:MAG: LppP/LprE family lipoprotein [Solirubrobacterales bacterium]|nr:LppP/LprE family lipoprotein [Solirubrobacterales bacterium]
MRTLLAALLAGCAALALGCGSGTRTVSVASSPPAHSSSPTAASHATGSATGGGSGGLTTSTTTSVSPTSAHSPTSSAPANATSTVTTTTRTAAGPAFARGEAEEGGDLAGAVAVVKAHGYTPASTSDYHPDQTLRVLVATNTGAADGAARAFFFVGSRYIGTDASTPSSSLSVAGQSDTEVTLSYPLYRPHDPRCCPSGGHAEVRFQLDNGKLVALDPIPPNSSQSGLSRGG